MGVWESPRRGTREEAALVALTFAEIPEGEVELRGRAAGPACVRREGIVPPTPGLLAKLREMGGEKAVP